MKNEPKPFQFPIPFDPFRILLALLEKLWLIIIAGLICGAVGLAAGLLILRTTHKAEMTIEKESAPAFWKLDLDSPWQPRPLTQEALQLIAESSEIYTKTGEMMTPPLSGKEVKARVGMHHASSENLYALQGRSKDSEKEALELSEAYATAIIVATHEKRQTEAKEAVKTFKTQLDHRRESVAKLSGDLAEFSKRSGFFDSDSETKGQVESRKLLTEKIVQARSELEAKRGQTRALMRNGTVGTIEKELNELRRDRTDEHPVVRAKQAELRRLEGKVQEMEASGAVDLAVLERELPPSMFTQAMRLQEETVALEKSLAEYDAMQAKWTNEITEMPAKALAVDDLKANLEKSLEAAVTIESRMKDAEFFASAKESPVKIFQRPLMGDGESRSGLSKGLILGTLGFLLGSAGMFFLVALAELCSKRLRTPMQTAIATSTMPKMSYPAPDPSRQTALMRDFWLKGVMRHLPDDRRFLFASGGGMASEKDFWDDLFDAVGRSTRDRVIFADISPDGVVPNTSQGAMPLYDPQNPAPISRLDSRAMTTEQFVYLADTIPEGYILIVRWGAEPDGLLAELGRYIDRWYLIASPQESQVVEIEETSSLFRGMLGNADGSILLNTKRPGRAGRFVAGLEEWFMDFRSQAKDEAKEAA